MHSHCSLATCHLRKLQSELLSKWDQFMKQSKLSNLSVNLVNDDAANDAQQSLDSRLHLNALLTLQRATRLESVCDRKVNISKIQARLLKCCSYIWSVRILPFSDQDSIHLLFNQPFWQLFQQPILHFSLSVNQLMVHFNRNSDRSLFLTYCTNDRTRWFFHTNLATFLVIFDQ